MKNLNSLLQRFSSLLDKKSLVKGAVASVVREKTGIDLPVENISIKESVLEITASPLVKSEIMLKSEAILSELKETRGLWISRILYK
ncbi:MAG: hypothetical protein WDZ61_00785 [Parcubacteria group bacterium]